MSLSKATIQFKSVADLWAYRISATNGSYQMNLAKCLITCLCTKEQIQLAVDKYNGKVVSVVKDQIA